MLGKGEEYRKSWKSLNKANLRSFKAKEKQWNQNKLVIHCHRTHSNTKSLMNSELQRARWRRIDFQSLSLDRVRYVFAFSELLQNDFKNTGKTAFALSALIDECGRPQYCDVISVLSRHTVEGKQIKISTDTKWIDTVDAVQALVAWNVSTCHLSIHMMCVAMLACIWKRVYICFFFISWSDWKH